MPREFQPFDMERLMSKYEQTVDYNLSESGVHPLRLSELLDCRPGALDGLLDVELGYPYVNGTPELRETIAGLYDGATPDNVLVTVGAIEANYLATRMLLGPGDEIVVMLPNYMQIWGIARNSGYRIAAFRLRPERGWAPDLAELEERVTPATRLIAVCNPNNPTGAALSEAAMDGIVAAAERVGAWILADEVYAGAERVAERQTPSFYGRYDRVVAVGSMSKAYGLPGLRVGWAVAPAETIDRLWQLHEYTTLSATALSNRLAALALSPEVRPRILERTRGYIRRGYPVLEEWAAARSGLIELTPPAAAAIAFLRYRLEVGSTELVERLRREKSVLVVPGDVFGMDGYLRISFGLPVEYLTTALGRLGELVGEIAAETPAPHGSG